MDLHEKTQGPAENCRLKSVTVSMEPSGKYFAVCCMKDTAAKTKQQIRITVMLKYLGLIMRCKGMAVFSEEIEMEEAGFFRKNEKGWQGSSVNCRDV